MYLHNILHPLTTTFQFNVTNSLELVNKLSNIKLPNNHVLISLDVKSLFTNIPKALVINIINKKWSFFSAYTDIPKSQLLSMIRHIFDTSYFTFCNTIYQQKDGTAMGNPLSPLLANIIMDDLLQTCLAQLPFEIPLSVVYVDDTLLAIPTGNERLILNTFNNYNDKNYNSR